MTERQKKIKRIFDVVFSFLGLLIFGWFIVFLIFFSKIIIGGRGLFIQKRIGQYGEVFSIYKIQTISIKKNRKEDRFIKLGKFLRKTKLDELPQLMNVFHGDMSFVGPRPDFPGFVDTLVGSDRLILTIKPGITGPATLYYRNEEKLLQNQVNPIKYNKEVIWPHKVLLNMKYIKKYSFCKDIYYLYKTLIF